MSEIGELVQVLRQSTITALPLSITSGFMLFAPTRLLDWFRVPAIEGPLRIQMVFLFLLSSIVSMGLIVKQPVERFSDKRRRDSSLRESFSDLSQDEKTLLNEHLKNGTKSMLHPIGSGTAHGLVKKGIMFVPSPVGRPGVIAFNIRDDAWTYLKKHPALLR